MNEYRIGTKCVQGGYTPGNGEPRQIPIVQSTTFKYATSEDMGKLFDLEASGYFYTRLQNPTNDMVAAKIAEMEGGTAAMLTSSGQAANFFALFNICECGDHIVASSSIYGGTFNLIDVTMRKMGIDVTFVSPDATEEELNEVPFAATSACLPDARLCSLLSARGDPSLGNPLLRLRLLRRTDSLWTRVAPWALAEKGPEVRLNGFGSNRFRGDRLMCGGVPPPTLPRP